jgi:PAS domain S-box-containing protein
VPWERLVEFAPLLLWQSGTDAQCISFSPSWLEFTGRTLEQELGSGWTTDVHPADLRGCLDAYHTAFAARREFQMEYRLRRADGEYRWVLDTGGPFSTPGGAFAGYTGSCVDITERKRIEETLVLDLALERLAAEVLRMTTEEDWSKVVEVFEQSARSVLRFDGCGVNLVDMDRDCSRCYGLAPVIGFYCNLHAGIQPALRLALETGRPVCRNNRRDPLFGPEQRAHTNSVIDVPFLGGTIAINSPDENAFGESEVYVLERFAKVLSSAHQRLSDLAALAQRTGELEAEIAERRRVEDALRASEARFRQLLRDAPAVAVQGYGPDGTTQYWNRASEDVYGYTASEALGRNLVDLIVPPEMRGFVEEAIRQMAETGQAIPAAELSLLRKDGTRVEVFSSHTIVQVPGRPQELFCIDIDLTERKRIEEERAILQAELQQSQKMELVGRLAGGIAHDFNNLLMGIMNYVELCQEALPGEHPVRAWLDEIMNDAERSADIVRQLLTFARRQPSEPEVLDLNDAMAGMLRMLRHLMGEDIDLSWAPAAEPWLIRVDPGQVSQVLANLCVNARDAIVGTGKVAIRTENVALDSAWCAAHTGVVPGDYVLLAVSDDGCGMSPDVLAHLFEPFFTTKGIGKGTGLGLATVHGIVKQNAGWIGATSEPGRGTTFTLYLPRAASAASSAEPLPVSPLATPPLRGAETILLVEDEKCVRVTTHYYLEQLGYTVLVADTPAAALRLAGEYAGPIHLLITDVVMPGQNGRDLAARLCESRPGLKCLFMSGYTTDVITQGGVLDAGVQFIPKPFLRNELAGKIRSVLAV